MKKTIGAFEAKTHLSELLEETARGSTFVITKHGNPVARLLPVKESLTDVPSVVAAIRQLRSENRLKGLSLKKLIEEGRR
jgi:prevent-host-death family protein